MTGARQSLAVALLAPCACNGPFLLASGGKLDAPVKPAPASVHRVGHRIGECLDLDRRHGREAGDVHELEARRVTDEAELDQVAEVWLSRNAWARDPRKLEGEVYVYELEPR